MDLVPGLVCHDFERRTIQARLLSLATTRAFLLLRKVPTEREPANGTQACQVTRLEGAGGSNTEQ